MQFKLRSVNTKFWEDPFVEGLKPEEKLIFLYFLTNPLTNMIGIYEITIKRISYDTGLTPERVQKALKSFESESKVFYRDNYVILPNFLKNQNLNTNMQKGAINVYDNLPNWLKDSISEKPLKAFESLRNAMLNMNKNMNSNVNENKNENNECELENENEKSELIYPFDSDEFKKWWNFWKEYKAKEHKFKYKTALSEQAALKKLSELSSGSEDIALKIIEQSIAEGWKGFFEMQQTVKKYNSDPQARAVMREKIASEFERKWKQ